MCVDVTSCPLAYCFAALMQAMFCFAILPSSSKRKVSVTCVKPDVGQRHTRKTEPAMPSEPASTRIAGAARPDRSERSLKRPVKSSLTPLRPLNSASSPVI